MSEILFLSAARLKETTEIHANVNDKLLINSILTVQDMVIEPLIGTKLMNKLKLLVETEIDTPGSATGIENATFVNYKTLLETYIEPTVKYYAVADAIPVMTYELGNKGVLMKEGENIVQSSTREREALQSDYRSKGDHYSDRLIRYLCANSTLFSEYTDGTDDVSQYKPQKGESYDTNFEF
jgi:hypothetical protein